ncbi:uncharacterized protein [Palaemon carinicauda]|uniref:uncharacterized protein n=1 Tax=Palaemon carinicauda TaxID=392227 RepID=UPI0035B5E233
MPLAHKLLLARHIGDCGGRLVPPAFPTFTLKVSMADSTEIGSAPFKLSSFTSGWIARFGISAHIPSDRGTSFTSQLWTSLANLLCINLHKKTAYNPTTNGMVESFIATLKSALMSCCKDSNWLTQLLWVLPGLRTTPKDALDISATEMVYGDLLVVPTGFSLLQPPPTISSAYITSWENLLHAAKLTSSQRSVTYRQTCTLERHVFLRNDTSKPPLTPPYTGPFLVIRRNPKAFLLNTRGKEDWFSIDGLKHAHLLPDDPPTMTRLQFVSQDQGTPFNMYGMPFLGEESYTTRVSHDRS